jgi:hypothetical protein
MRISIKGADRFENKNGRNPPSVDSIIMLFKKLCAVDVCRLGFNGR